MCVLIYLMVLMLASIFDAVCSAPAESVHLKVKVIVQ